VFSFSSLWAMAADGVCIGFLASPAPAPVPAHDTDGEADAVGDESMLADVTMSEAGM